MPRRTHPKRRNQAPRQVRRGHDAIHRTTVVKPVGRCKGRSGKLQFATEEIAAEALAQAKEYKLATGNTGRIEKRYYECPDCELWHLTHLETWVEREES